MSDGFQVGDIVEFKGWPWSWFFLGIIVEICPDERPFPFRVLVVSIDRKMGIFGYASNELSLLS